jgi:hypothetical protein
MSNGASPTGSPRSKTAKVTAPGRPLVSRALSACDIEAVEEAKEKLDPASGQPRGVFTVSLVKSLDAVMSAATGGDAACFRDVWDNLTSNWTHDQVLLGKQRLFSRRMAGKHVLFSPHPPHLGGCVWALCVCVERCVCASRAHVPD